VLDEGKLTKWAGVLGPDALHLFNLEKKITKNVADEIH
jgi:hypothetical protein